MTNVTLFWFRRDLRVYDNAGLYEALKAAEQSQIPVLPLFIFDTDILSKLTDKKDARVEFLHRELLSLKSEFQQLGSDLVIESGTALEVLQKISRQYGVVSLYTNHDYEPSARKRDESVRQWCEKEKIIFQTFKDQTLFEKDEILTSTGTPYTVYTPYKNKVLQNLAGFYLKPYPTEKYLQKKNLLQVQNVRQAPTLESLGFQKTDISFPENKVSKQVLLNYAETRNFPALEAGTSHLGLHLRFGTVSVRELAQKAKDLKSDVWLSELIWRDFFMQILWHFPHVEKKSFRAPYDEIAWRDSEKDFSRWCEGQTGYPIVDAGMRELNATGYMHNRVRMITASFLCKHLLIHWYQGERYFAQKLLDYDLSANNGNWQWAAGSGCDAAPYFRIFNPTTQAEKFDPDSKYIKKWVPEVGTKDYAKPMVDHVEARSRVLTRIYESLKKGVIYESSDDRSFRPDW